MWSIYNTDLGGTQGFLTTYFKNRPKTFINNRVYNVKTKIRDKRPCTPDIAAALEDKVRNSALRDLPPPTSPSLLQAKQTPSDKSR